MTTTEDVLASQRQHEHQRQATTLADLLADRPTVAPQVPTYAIDRILGWTFVGTPAAVVEQMIRDRVAEAKTAAVPDEADSWTEAITEQTVTYALWRHSYNLAEYRAVMGR